MQKQDAQYQSRRFARDLRRARRESEPVQNELERRYNPPSTKSRTGEFGRCGKSAGEKVKAKVAYSGGFIATNCLTASETVPVNMTGTWRSQDALYEPIVSNRT